MSALGIDIPGSTFQVSYPSCLGALDVVPSISICKRMWLPSPLKAEWWLCASLFSSVGVPKRLVPSLGFVFEPGMGCQLAGGATS